MDRFVTAFEPYLSGPIEVSPDGTSDTIAIPIDARQLRLHNTGANICYVAVGNVPLTASTASVAVPAGEIVTIRKAIGHDLAAFISASGTTLEITPGNGTITQGLQQLASAPALRALLLQGAAVIGEVSTLTIANATAGSTLSVVRGALPAGLTLNSAGRAIEGTRTGAGTAFVVQETLANSPNSPQWTAFSIGDAVPSPTPAPTLGALSLDPAIATVGIAYSGSVVGKTAGSTLALTGAGAEGLSVNNETGAVTGTPTTDGTVNIVETLAGATNSPRTTNDVLTVAAAGPALISEIDATGFGATWADGTPPTFDPEGDPQVINVTRLAYDSSGNETTALDPVIITSRMRTVASTLVSPRSELTADKVALARTIYVGDTATDVVNNSTARSPKPVAQWAVGHRDFFQRYLVAEIVAGHRDAQQNKQIAGVRFIATDGVDTVTEFVSETVIAGRAGDQIPLEVYRCNIDCLGLDDGTITLDAEVVPFYGRDNADYALSSIRKTAQETIASPSKIRGFVTRYYRKASGGWPIAYVSASGTATTSSAGWKLDDSHKDNLALQYPTLRLALQSMVNAANTAVTGSVIEGEVRLGAGTFFMQGDTIARQGGVGALLITRDPRVDKSLVIARFGAGSWATLLNAPAGINGAVGVIVRDVSFQRSGDAAISANDGSKLEVWMDNVDYDRLGVNNALGGDIFFTGFRITDSNAGGALGSISLGAVTTRSNALIRGVECDMADGAVEMFNVMGSRILRIGTQSPIGRDEGADQFMIYRNIFPNALAGPALGSDIQTGCYISQNLWEVLGTSATTILRLSADDDAGSTEHVIIEGNIFPGAYSTWRWNIGYTDGTTRTRTHKLWAIRGNVLGQLNNKSDLFTFDADSVGNWGLVYSVNCYSNCIMFIDANNDGNAIDTAFRSFSPTYIGMWMQRGTSADDAIAGMDFVDWKAVTRVAGVNIAGTGGGDYHIGPSSILQDLVKRPYRSFDWDGAAVGSTDNAGLYT